MEIPDHHSIQSLAVKLGDVAARCGLCCVTAESCTGGMVAAAITDIAGSSAWFDRSFVTYSNEAKVEMLGVLEETLSIYGAVSEQVVAEMAKGALHNSAGHVSVAISGIAGPGGGSEEKPVGTVCFSFAREQGLSVYTTTRHFLGNRDEVRRQACAFALAGLIATINETFSDLNGVQNEI